MSKHVAVIGAGPAGLAGAKEAIVAGFEVTIFEAARTVGGLWRQPDGATWSSMRTNLSKWTCCFSDHPWGDDAAEFPTAPEMYAYLRAYAERHRLLERTRFGRRVQLVEPHEGRWRLIDDGGDRFVFDVVIVASGFFGEPAELPSAVEGYAKPIHSAAYRDRSVSGEIVVVGGSMSAVEIVGHLATSGNLVKWVVADPPWIMPRYVNNERGGSIPIDLFLNRRSADSQMPMSPIERRRKAAAYFETTFGNPGRFHPALAPDRTGERPITVAISDTVLEALVSGRITIHRGRLAEGDGRAVTTDRGERVEGDAVLICSGYRPNLAFLPEVVSRAIELDLGNKLLPIIARKNVIANMRPDIYFIGMYKGPYFGAMELQARLAVAAMAGTIEASILDDLAYQRQVRTATPPPQFPFRYIEMCDGLAEVLGVMPDLDQRLFETPVTPAQYRLIGSNACLASALAQVKAVQARAGLPE